MKRINVNFNKFYPSKHWFFTFRRYSHVKGFIIRIFGFYINVVEKNTY